jgi:hypothetical protein
MSKAFAMFPGSPFIVRILSFTFTFCTCTLFTLKKQPESCLIFFYVSPLLPNNDAPLVVADENTDLEPVGFLPSSTLCALLLLLLLLLDLCFVEPPLTHLK